MKTFSGRRVGFRGAGANIGEEKTGPALAAFVAMRNIFPPSTARNAPRHSLQTFIPDDCPAQSATSSRRVGSASSSFSDEPSWRSKLLIHKPLRHVLHGPYDPWQTPRPCQGPHQCSDDVGVSKPRCASDSTKISSHGQTLYLSTETESACQRLQSRPSAKVAAGQGAVQGCEVLTCHREAEGILQAHCSLLEMSGLCST